MHRSNFQKPDGRRLWLYGRRAIEVAEPVAPVPDAGRVHPASHLRWHPIDGEWVIYAAHRQQRPLTAPGAVAANPLAPTLDPSQPTELPRGRWDVAVFENRFPSLSADPGLPPHIAGAQVASAMGGAEVIVFAQDATTPLGRLGTEHIALVLEVIAERTQSLAAQGARYVLPFENRGAEMGVTLHHPHAQIYAYGFLPGRQARALKHLRAHLAQTGRDLVSDIVASTLADGTRLLDSSGAAVSLVPAFARFPYEVWVVPRRHAPNLASLDAGELHDVAAALGAALRRLDGLWSRPMPYLMTINQAPPDGEPHPEWTVRIEIWPVRRAADKLKYLAGTELGAGVFASDVLPEEAAARLRAVEAPP